MEPRLCPLNLHQAGSAWALFFIYSRPDSFLVKRILKDGIPPRELRISWGNIKMYKGEKWSLCKLQMKSEAKNIYTYFSEFVILFFSGLVLSTDK